MGSIESDPIGAGPARTPYRVFPTEGVTRMPKAVVIERSFVLAALEGAVPGHDAAAAFLERMVAAETTLFFNDVLELQLQDDAFDLAEREVGVPGARSGTTVSELARSMLARWQSLISSADAVYVELAPLLEDVLYYRERFGLPALDSVQAAMVMASGADGIATVDRNFGAVDPSLLPIFTPQSFVQSTRDTRSASGWPMR
ncbi:hypothetical protein [Curtobacterium pusillum]|uniref:hypothetical protein n=1 Tax=Curtobacterium pusillum TaxID=69373 RepID=UPI0011A565A8|nr:hypothetical protein [Curtobacterium pusillum]